MGIRLSNDEAWAELAAAHTGILTTLRNDGKPINLPVWFVALDKRIYVQGPAHTHKFARIRHDPRVAFLVESGERWSQLRAVHLSGTALVVTDDALVARVSAALTEKYDGFRTPRTAMPNATRTHYSRAPTTIEIVPDERILSWDNTRLRLDT